MLNFDLHNHRPLREIVYEQLKHKLNEFINNERTISPNASVFSGTTTSLKLDTIAKAIDKSAAGSSIWSPPITFA